MQILGTSLPEADLILSIVRARSVRQFTSWTHIIIMEFVHRLEIFSNNNVFQTLVLFLPSGVSEQNAHTYKGPLVSFRNVDLKRSHGDGHSSKQ
jgi:hypothetical protein